MTTDEATPSPYRPGFNQAPLVLAGRDDVLMAADEAIAVAALERRTPPPLVLVGSRGVGKTVLLLEIAGRAGSTHGWPHLHVEVRPSTPFTPRLIETAATITATLRQSGPAGRMRATEAVVRAQVAGIGGEVRLTRDSDRDPDTTLRLGAALEVLSTEAAERTSGVVLTLDEAQLASRSELADLAAVLQQATGADWPLVVALAGLESLRGPDRVPTYLERADWHALGSLDQEATLAALLGPAEEAGRPFELAAARHLGERTGGYPYAIQLYGHHAWRASRGQTRIGMDAVVAAERTATAQLERGLFDQRWAQASRREREYLVAVAEDQAEHGTATGASVAQRLGVTTRQLSSYRHRLLTKGTLVAEGELLGFAIPGMTDYVRRHAVDAHRARRARQARPTANQG